MAHGHAQAYHKTNINTTMVYKGNARELDGVRPRIHRPKVANNTTPMMMKRGLRHTCGRFASFAPRALAAATKSRQLAEPLRRCKSSTALATTRPEYEAEAKELDKLLDAVKPLLHEYHLKNGTPDVTKVVEFRKPADLERVLDLKPPEEGQSMEKSVEDIKKALEYSVRTAHPRFFDKLYAGSDPIGQVSELVTAVLNTNVHTFAVAPVFAMIETEVIRSMAEKIGFNRETADGIFVPGGTYANMSALMLARDAFFPHVRTKGYRGERPVCFTSAQAHYSIKRAAMMAGIGMDSCINVAADSKGCMVPEALDEALSAAKENGQVPFFVSATAGTTVMGGFDPFEEIRRVCDKHGVWMHVDGAWGGSAVMSPKHRHLLKGAELADSFAWNPHKGLGTPIFTSVLITNNHKGALEKANNSSAEYLFHKHDASDYDLGDKSLQCGRRADCFKIWMSWRKWGSEGWAKRIDTAFENAQYIKNEIVKRKGRFVLVEEPMGCNVCFWFVPESVRHQVEECGGDISTVYPSLDTATSIIYDRMQECGSMLLNFNPLSDHQLPRFFRIILNQPRVRTEDLDFVLDEIERLGADL